MRYATETLDRPATIRKMTLVGGFAGAICATALIEREAAWCSDTFAFLVEPR
jgi:hypothetical protein